MAQNKHHELSPLSTGYHDVAEGYITHFFKLIGVTIIPHGIGFLLYTSASVALIASAARVDNIFDIFAINNTNFVVTLGLVLLIFAIQLIGAIALVYMVTRREEATIHDSFEKALHYVWRFLGVGIAFVVASSLGLIVGSVIMFVIGSVLGFFSLELLNSAFSLLTGSVLTITTTLASAFLVFAPISVVAQDNSVKAAVRESMHLVRGHFWPILFRLGLMYVLVFILTFVLQFIPTIGTTITAVVVTPFAVMYLYDMYADLVERKGTPA